MPQTPHWHIPKVIRFVHASDLHLDSPFKGLTSVLPEYAERLNASTFETFDKIIELCIDRKVDFLLVAGDVYDGADRSLRAQLRFQDGLARLDEHGIASFTVHGNHDPLDGWSSSIHLAEKARSFGPNISREDYEGVQIYGMSYPSRAETRNLARTFPSRPRRPEPRPFRIGLLHCNVAANPQHLNYAPCELSDLHAADIDYWALGHVHDSKVLSQYPHVVYPGNTQGRSFRETGKRGCYLVEVDPTGQIGLEFQDISAVRWCRAEVLIDGLTTVNGLEQAIHDSLERQRVQAARPLVCRVELKGRGPLYRELRRDRQLDDMLQHVRQKQLRKTPYLWVDRLEMLCVPDVDLVELAGRADLVGSILRLADEYQASVDTSLESVLAPIWGDPRITRYVDSLTSEEMKQILIDARFLCIEHLGGIG